MYQGWLTSASRDRLLLAAVAYAYLLATLGLAIRRFGPRWQGKLGLDGLRLDVPPAWSAIALGFLAAIIQLARIAETPELWSSSSWLPWTLAGLCLLAVRSDPRRAWLDVATGLTGLGFVATVAPFVLHRTWWWPVGMALAVGWLVADRVGSRSGGRFQRALGLPDEPRYPVLSDWSLAAFTFASASTACLVVASTWFGPSADWLNQAGRWPDVMLAIGLAALFVGLEGRRFGPEGTAGRFRSGGDRRGLVARGRDVAGPRRDAHPRAEFSCARDVGDGRRGSSGWAWRARGRAWPDVEFAGREPAGLAVGLHAMGGLRHGVDGGRARIDGRRRRRAGPDLGPGRRSRSACWRPTRDGSSRLTREAWPGAGGCWPSWRMGRSSRTSRHGVGANGLPAVALTAALFVLWGVARSLRARTSKQPDPSSLRIPRAIEQVAAGMSVLAAMLTLASEPRGALVGAGVLLALAVFHGLLALRWLVECRFTWLRCSCSARI